MVYEATEFPHTCRVIGEEIGKLNGDRCCEKTVGKIDELRRVLRVLLTGQAYLTKGDPCRIEFFDGRESNNFNG